MKKVIVLLAFFATTLVLSNFSYAHQAKADDGEALYQEHCKSCHGKKGKGAMFGLYPPLTDKAWTGNDTLIVQNITKGLRGEIQVNGKTYNKEMAKIVGLSDVQIALIVNYVRKEITKINKPITSEKVKQLRNL